MTTSDTVGTIENLRQDLRRLRRRKGLSQKELGNILGITQTGYGSFERGRTTLRGAPLDRAFRLAEQWRAEEHDIPPAEPEPAPRLSPPSRLRPLLLCDTTCPHCGKDVPGPSQGMLRCGCCGGALAKICPACRHVNIETRARYCTQCGAALSVRET